MMMEESFIEKQDPSLAEFIKVIPDFLQQSTYLKDIWDLPLSCGLCFRMQPKPRCTALQALEPVGQSSISPEGFPRKT